MRSTRTASASPAASTTRRSSASTSRSRTDPSGAGPGRSSTTVLARTPADNPYDIAKTMEGYLKDARNFRYCHERAGRDPGRVPGPVHRRVLRPDPGRATASTTRARWRSSSARPASRRGSSRASCRANGAVTGPRWSGTPAPTPGSRSSSPATAGWTSTRPAAASPSSPCRRRAPRNRRRRGRRSASSRTGRASPKATARTARPGPRRPGRPPPARRAVRTSRSAALLAHRGAGPGVRRLAARAAADPPRPRLGLHRPLGRPVRAGAAGIADRLRVRGCAGRGGADRAARS